MKACDTLLETALNLDDVKLRGLISSLVSDMNRAFDMILCSEDNDDLEIEIEKKTDNIEHQNYFS